MNATLAALPCPQWCVGDCGDLADDTRHHGSAFTDVPAASHVDGPVTLSVSASRVDRDNADPTPAVSVLIAPNGRISADDLTLTPEQARQLAAALLAAADNADARRGLEVVAP